MKKSLIIMLLLLLNASTFLEGSEKHFQARSGIIKYSFNASNLQTNNIKNEWIHYFDDYGNKQTIVMIIKNASNNNVLS